MNLIFSIILTLYCVALAYITIYCLLQLNLLFYYKKNNKRKSFDASLEQNEKLPFVTIQLPIYNEMYVVERLIDTIIQMDYPKDRFEIHVLDDSTDQTVEITRNKVEEYKTKGFLIEHIRRKDRKGYKAGALKEAMPYAKGEFIAIFDADFLPKKDFLKTTVAHFKDKNVGVVQTRWEHINQDYSILTRLQALQLNVHFTVEQTGRSSGDFLLQFNGTAGVWRRACIDDAGGWEADTLTEDLDLSYRAQLKGWKIIYLEKFGSPAELPAEINGLKSQQFRWMKGGAETAKKIIPSILKSHLPWRQKFHAIGHLMASTVFVFIFLAAILSVPLLFIFPYLTFNANYLSVFLLGLIAMSPVYYVANVQAELKEERYTKLLFKFLILFPVFLSLSMGLSLHNAIAVLQGYFGKKSPFVRTPKFNIKSISDSFKKQNYKTTKIKWTTIMEGILSLYFIGGIIAGLILQDYTFVIFHSLLAMGFGTIFYYSINHLSTK